MTLDPRLLGAYGFAIAFDIVFPLIIGFFIHRRYDVRWRFFLYGMLVFFLSQIITRIPIVQLVQAVYGTQIQSNPTLLYGWFAVLAITAGLFEEVGRWLGYRFLIKNDRTWRVGLMYGAGHGGLESMLLVGGLALLGLINVITIANTDFSKLGLSPTQLAQIEAARQQIAALDWWTPLLGAYERFVTVFFQIALSILVLQVFLRNSWLWLVLAIALHALVDFGVVVLARMTTPAGVEAVLTVLLPLSFVIIYYFRPRSLPPVGPVVTAEPLAPAS